MSRDSESLAMVICQLAHARGLTVDEAIDAIEASKVMILKKAKCGPLVGETSNKPSNIVLETIPQNGLR